MCAPHQTPGRVPDGKFKAHPLLPERYMLYFPTEEEFILTSKERLNYDRIQQGSSAYASFELGWNNHLNGHRKGKFQFYGLNPGKYLLSANIKAPFVDNDKATTFYYPNVSTVDQAREISIGENETIDEREIRLSPGYIVRQIEGILGWPNGVPVSGGWVSLAASKDSHDDDKKYEWGSTDALGRFSLQAFVGAEYWVRGESHSSGAGDPIKIKVEMTQRAT